MSQNQGQPLSESKQQINTDELVQKPKRSISGFFILTALLFIFIAFLMRVILINQNKLQETFKSLENKLVQQQKELALQQTNIDFDLKSINRNMLKYLKEQKFQKILQEKFINQNELQEKVKSLENKLVQQQKNIDSKIKSMEKYLLKYLKGQKLQENFQENFIDQNELQETVKSLENKLVQQQKNIDSKFNSMETIMNSTQVSSNLIYRVSMEEYHIKKMQYIRQRSQQTWGIVKDVEKARVSLLLAMNNFNYEHFDVGIQEERKKLLKIQYLRLSKEYNFQLPQNSFCVVVPTLNNNQNFRNIYNLRSIFNQDYSNYSVVIIDDASTDKNLEVISQYIKDNPVPQKVHLVQNKRNKKAVYNIHLAATKYCNPEDILLLVDGDDQLLGINVFKVFNSIYTTKNLTVAYSNFLVNDKKKKQVKKGFSQGYSQEIKNKNSYRDEYTRMFPVRTFKVSTFLKIQEKYLQSDEGQWFDSAYDEVICPQVLELSCGKNEYIEEFFYLYNFGLGNNDFEIDPNRNTKIMKMSRARQRHSCPKQQ